MRSTHMMIAAAFVFVTGSIGCNTSDAKNKSAAVPRQATETAQTQQPPLQAGEIRWLYNLNDGKIEARDTGKPLMVDFYADWCGWCKKLDTDVYAKPEIVGLSEKFVNVKVDTDKYGRDAQAFGVRGLPTIVFLKSDGTILQQISGYRDSEEFVRVMNEVLADAGTR